MLYAALEIESDAFWSSISEKGYKAAVDRQLRVCKSLHTSHTWLNTFPSSQDPVLAESFQGVARAIKFSKTHAKQQNKCNTSSDESDDDQFTMV